MKEVLFDYIDEQAEYIKESRKLNFLRWDILKRIVSVNPVSMCTYKKEIQYLKDWIIERFEQLDGMIGNATIDFINEEIRGGWGGMGGGGFNWTQFGNFSNFNWTQFGNFSGFNFTFPGQGNGGGFGGFNWTFPGQGNNNNRTQQGRGGFDFGAWRRPGGEENLGPIEEHCIGVEDDEDDENEK